MGKKRGRRGGPIAFRLLLSQHPPTRSPVSNLILLFIKKTPSPSPSPSPSHTQRPKEKRRPFLSLPSHAANASSSLLTCPPSLSALSCRTCVLALYPTRPSYHTNTHTTPSFSFSLDWTDGHLNRTQQSPLLPSFFLVGQSVADHAGHQQEGP